jgi:hypothetical protein
MFDKVILGFLISALSLPGMPEEERLTPRTKVISAAFAGGYTGTICNDRFPIRPVRLGDMELPSGRLSIADPFSLHDADTPIVLEVPPGRHQVDLAVADTGTGGTRVALARLLFSKNPTVRWSMALKPGQDPSKLTLANEFFPFAVDAGTGAFLDSGAVAWLQALPFETKMAMDEKLQERGDAKAKELGMPHQLALIEKIGPGDVAMFSSGWGDGYYGAWIGYDFKGRPTMVLIDFAVIDAMNQPIDCGG